MHPAPEILAAIPHRPPMLLVDEIVSQTEQRIVCRKTFRADEYFLQGHYPGFPLVPGVILCECAMQAGAILLSKQPIEKPGVPVATRMNDVKFRRMVRPGDVIDIEVTLDERLQDTFFLAAKVTVGKESAVRLSFACTVTAVEPAGGGGE